MKKSNLKNIVEAAKTDNIFNYLEIIAQLIPAPFYWLNTKNILLGANDIALKSIGVTREIVIGKSAYDIYPSNLAEKIVVHNQAVIRSRKISSQEETIKDVYTGEIKYFSAMKAPLQDCSGKVIGLVGVSIDITAEKEAERLKIENEKHKAKIAAQEEFITIINEFNHILQKHKYNVLNRDLGIKDKLDGSDKNKKIHLSPREQEILYYLSLNKSPKAIATILSILDDTKILASTIQATINKRMYFKFDVNNTDELIEKANHLNLIPVLLPKRIK